MSLLIFAAVIWGICKLLSAASRKAEAERAERERQRIREEQAAQRREIAEMRERSKQETRRQIEQEKARIAWQKRQDAINRQAQADRERLRKEQERQAREQARLADEQEKMRRTLTQATADIDFLRERVADLDAQLDYQLLLQSSLIPGTPAHDKCQRKIVTLRNQIHAAETRMNKAQWSAETAQRKLA